MKQLKDFRDEQLEEGVFRSGAVANYASRARKHGDKAVQHFRSAEQQIGKLKRQEALDEKIDLLADVLDSTVSGLTELRMQIGAVSAQIVASSVLDKKRR